MGNTSDRVEHYRNERKLFFPHNFHAGLKSHFIDFDLKNNFLALCKLAVTNTQYILVFFFSLFKEKQSTR